MKNIIALFACLITLGAIAQNETETRVLEKSEIVCIIPQKRIEPIVYQWDANAYHRAQLKQPVLTNEQIYGTMPLSEDLPFVHTLRGAVYTFDYIRATARP